LVLDKKQPYQENVLKINLAMNIRYSFIEWQSAMLFYFAKNPRHLFGV